MSNGIFHRVQEPGAAWLTLTLAIALHVTDEAITGFLSVYNPTVLRIREALPFVPLPTFTFQVWIGGLATGVVLLLFLTPCAARKVSWLRPVALVLAAFMVLNALGHFGGSVALGYVMPGAYSSLLLLAAAINLLVSAQMRWRPTADAA